MIMPDLSRTVLAALREDRAFQDVTSRFFLPRGTRARAVVVSRRPGVAAGVSAAAAAFRLRDRRVRVKVVVPDGGRLAPGLRVLELEGPLASILSAERTALNLLGHLSGVATLTREFVRRAGGRAAVLDTRKTLPGLRDLQKDAVRRGGGTNHRRDLSDAVLIKENHLASVRSERDVALFLRRIAAVRRRGLPVIMEARNRKEILWALVGGVDVLLLDNFPPKRLSAVTRWIKSFCAAKEIPRPLLEASGGVSLKTVGAISRAGVDRISVGQITHSVPWLDVGLDIR
jgi:nicotinate-nucleotide pyrophosphorylase (carboxylating)